MAVRSTAFPFDDLDLKIGGSALEGVRTCRLVITQNTAETVAAAPTTWTDYCKGIRAWSISGSGGWNEAAAECGVGASIKVDGTNAVLGVRNFTINMTAGMADITSQSSSGVRQFVPARRTVSMDFDGVYFDPLYTSAKTSTFWNNVIDGTTSCSVVAAFGTGSSVTFTGYASQGEITRNDNEAVMMSGTINATGTVTDGTAGATVIDAVVEAFFGETSLTALLTSGVVGETAYTGTVYVANFSISVPFEGQIEYSYTLQGSGTLTDYAVT